MGEFDSVPLGEPPGMAQPSWEGTLNASWEDMLNDLLQGPDTVVGGADEQKCTASLDDGALLGFVDGSFGDVIGLGDDPLSGLWDYAVPVDAVLNQVNLSDLSDAFIIQESESLPGLSSEVSSLADDLCPVADNAKSSMDVDEGGHDAGVSSPGSCNRVDADEVGHDAGVSSPGSCNRVEADYRPLANSKDEVGMISSQSVSPIMTSCADLKAASPYTGCDSSDVGAVGRSCDNFADLSERHNDSPPGDLDEDSKRQSRLMRNRESATQSRLRKKSYVKDLEAKCRAMESQLSMLHQTVAFTSAQNTTLREELAHVKSLKGNASKSGATEPAVLPSYSLPSEYPSRHTFPCLSVKLEFVVFLCHVLLLTLFQALPLKRAASGENFRSEARVGRHSANLGVLLIQHRVVTRPGKGCLGSSNWRKKRIISSRDDSSFTPHRKSSIATSSLKLVVYRSDDFSSKDCKSSSSRCLTRFRRRSQYNSLPSLRSSTGLYRSRSESSDL